MTHRLGEAGAQAAPLVDDGGDQHPLQLTHGPMETET